MPKLTAERKRLLLRLRPFFLLLLLLVIFMWATHPWWLPSICSWLDVSEKPQHADFIIYLGGEENSRAKRAAELYQEGYAPKIIASGDPLRIQDGLAILSNHGILIKDIIINNQATNTWDESQQIFAILREKNAHSALIVTSASHTRRASATYESFQNASRIVLTFVADKAAYRCENWWNTSSGKYAMQYEYPRIVFYLFHYGISAF